MNLEFRKKNISVEFCDMSMFIFPFLRLYNKLQK